MNTNKRYIPAKLLVLILCGTIFVGGLTACNSRTENTNFPKDNITVSASSNNKKPTANKTQIKSLSEIDATFSHTKWHNKPYIKIDEESLLDIIRLAMRDAKDMYMSIGAPPMTITESGSTSKNPDEFYPEWMNEYHFLARAKRESGNYMIDYIGPVVDEAGNRAVGIMSVVPEYIVPTLNQYMKNTFHSDITFSNRQLLPSNKDLANFENSKQARENLKKAVYDIVYTSICYDIYNAKCFGPNHKDYYAKFGGYNEEIRHQAIVALYLYRRNDVVSSLKNGTFFDEFADTDYVQDILNFQDDFENQYQNQTTFDK